MSKLDLLQTVCSFFNGNVNSALELTFSNLTIVIIQNGIPLKQLLRDSGHIRICKKPSSELATMQVLDNLVFNFSFHFVQPKVLENYTHKMLVFPSSISNGHIQLDSQKLVLDFNLSSRDKNLNVGLRHIYSGLVG